MNKLIKEYNQTFENLVIEFTKRYYETDEVDELDYDIHESDIYGPGPILIGDLYFSIEEIWQCIQLDIPMKVMLDWNDFCLDKGLKDEPIGINLYKFWRKETLGEEEYKKLETSELRKAEKRLVKSAKYFKKALGVDYKKLLEILGEA